MYLSVQFVTGKIPSGKKMEIKLMDFFFFALCVLYPVHTEESNIFLSYYICQIHSLSIRGKLFKHTKRDDTHTETHKTYTTPRQR